MNPNAVPQLLASDPCPLHIAHVAELRAEEQARQNENAQPSGTDSESGADTQSNTLSLEARALKYDQMIERLNDRRARCENQLKRKRVPLFTAGSMKKVARSEFAINASTYAEAIYDAPRVKTKPREVVQRKRTGLGGVTYGGSIPDQAAPKK